MDRRDFLKSGLITVGTLVVAPAAALASATTPSACRALVPVVSAAQLAPRELLDRAARQMLHDIGVPPELYDGTAKFQASSVALELTKRKPRVLYGPSILDFPGLNKFVQPYEIYERLTDNFIVTMTDEKGHCCFVFNPGTTEWHHLGPRIRDYREFVGRGTFGTYLWLDLVREQPMECRKDLEPGHTYLCFLFKDLVSLQPSVCWTISTDERGKMIMDEMNFFDVFQGTGIGLIDPKTWDVVEEGQEIAGTEYIAISVCDGHLKAVYQAMQADGFLYVSKTLFKQFGPYKPLIN